MNSISIENLAAELQSPGPVVVLDVRREQARTGTGLQMGGAIWRNPAHWLDWKDEFVQAPRVVLYCAHGKEISQGLTAALRAMGVNASYLVGGFGAWQSEGHPVQEPLVPDKPLEVLALRTASSAPAPLPESAIKSPPDPQVAAPATDRPRASLDALPAPTAAEWAFAAHTP